MITYISSAVLSMSHPYNANNLSCGITYQWEIDFYSGRSS